MMTVSAVAKVAFIFVVANGPSIPHLDVRRTCQDIAGSAGLQSCLSEERYALTKLKKYWMRIPLDYKKQCIFDPSTPGRSYSFLRDCINNNLMLQKSKDLL